MHDLHASEHDNTGPKQLSGAWGPECGDGLQAGRIHHPCEHGELSVRHATDRKDKYRNVNPHVDPLGSGPINDLCHTRIVGCFGDVDCRNLTDPTGTYFYNSSTGAYNNRSPGGDSIDINSVNGVPLSVGQGRTSGTSQPTSSSSSIGSSEMPSATVPSTSSDTASTTEGQQLASSGASAAPAAESKNADSSGAAMTTPLVSVLGLAVVALFW